MAGQDSRHDKASHPSAEGTGATTLKEARRKKDKHKVKAHPDDGNKEFEKYGSQVVLSDSDGYRVVQCEVCKVKQTVGPRRNPSPCRCKWMEKTDPAGSNGEWPPIADEIGPDSTYKLKKHQGRVGTSKPRSNGSSKEVAQLNRKF